MGTSSSMLWARACGRPFVRGACRLAAATLALFISVTAAGASSDPRYFDRGTPVLQDIWVDPVSGDNGNSGATRLLAVRTLTEAWGRVPISTTLTTTGYRIRLVAGTYLQADVPNYFESRYGTHAHPVIIEAADGAGTAFLPALNIFDCRFLYLLGLHIAAGGGDVLHCEACDHFVVNEVTVRGAAPETLTVQETVKVNQSQNVFIEDSDISGGWDNAIDFVGVQYGHIQGNRIHDAGDWCLYVKGGSAGLRVESNEIYDCGTGGFTAGQGTGFEFMTSPWLHYEAVDIRFVNNLIHDTAGAGFGVNGGYNILLAYNTMYRVGSISHVLEFVFGLRGCDGNTAQCNAFLAAGGWGTAGAIEESIPNRNVYAYNNIVYNPAPFQSQWQHLAIYGPRTTSPSSNIPSPASTDTNLRFRGNVVWNGPSTHPLGIEDTDQGCQPANPTCNATQLALDNSFNSIEPQFVNAGAGNFQPLPMGSLYAATTYAPPDFPGDDRPSPPLAPQGELTNVVDRDFTGAPRGPASPPGAFGADCAGAVCGDNTFDLGCEACDDGDLVDGDGCDSNCTVTACGNGIATAGEACDDGNDTNGDGCDGNCTVTACGNGVVTSGEECDDGNLIAGDGCDASCRLDCPSAPSALCSVPTRARAAKLRVTDAVVATRDSLKWKLTRAPGTTLETLGNPLASTSYMLCIYDRTATTPNNVLAARIPSAADCGVPGCWTAGRNRYRYKVTTPGRMDVRLQTKTGAIGAVSVTTRGVAAFMPSLPFVQDPSLTVQMHSSTGACWGASYSAPASRNTLALFNDSSD